MPVVVIPRFILAERGQAGIQPKKNLDARLRGHDAPPEAI